MHIIRFILMQHSTCVQCQRGKQALDSQHGAQQREQTSYNKQLQQCRAHGVARLAGKQNTRSHCPGLLSSLGSAGTGLGAAGCLAAQCAACLAAHVRQQVQPRCWTLLGLAAYADTDCMFQHLILMGCREGVMFRWTGACRRTGRSLQTSTRHDWLRTR